MLQYVVLSYLIKCTLIEKEIIKMCQQAKKMRTKMGYNFEYKCTDRRFLGLDHSKVSEHFFEKLSTYDIYSGSFWLTNLKLFLKLLD